MEYLGALSEKQKPTDMSSDGLSAGITTYVPGGQWDNYLPVVEFQNNYGYDRYACVTYSLLNCVEVKVLRILGLERNRSDRFLAKNSGTTYQGNYFTKVFDTLAEEGVVLEAEYPDTKDGWDEYYKAIPSDIMSKATIFTDRWAMYREWIPVYKKDEIKMALEESPLQVMVQYASGDGILNPSSNKGHAVMLYGYVENEYWKIFDHYIGAVKKYAWDYEFGAILKPTMILKDNYKPMTFEQNRLYLLVEGNEQKLRMFLDGNLVEFPTWSMTRENSNARIGKWMPPISTKLIDWRSVKHTNSKGETIDY